MTDELTAELETVFVANCDELLGILDRSKADSPAAGPSTPTSEIPSPPPGFGGRTSSSRWRVSADSSVSSRSRAGR